MASQTYIIQLNDNLNYCVGVNSISNGTGVILKLSDGVNDKTVQWVFNDDGTICSAGNPDLCISQAGVTVSQGQLSLNPVVPGQTTQQWNWLGQSPYIANVGQPTMVLDNSGGNNNVANPVLVWPMHNGSNQQWTMLTVQQARERAAAATA